MKLLLPVLTLLTTCCGMSMAAVGDSVNPMSGFVAEGVAGTFDENGQFSLSATSSTRFYDSTKGWVSTGDYTGDSAMCWAHTSANMIQYWQSYYGVFYKGDASLPYGTDYERTISGAFSSKTIADPMRLNVYQAFYDGWRNSGGTIENGTNWYFTWQEAGYFKEYFGAYDYKTLTQPNTATITDVTGAGTAGLATALLSAMGVSRQSDGSYVQKQNGMQPHIFALISLRSIHGLCSMEIVCPCKGSATPYPNPAAAHWYSLRLLPSHCAAEEYDTAYPHNSD